MGALRLQVSLAARYLSGRTLRTVLTTVAVSLGVALIFGLNSLFPAILQAFESQVLSATGTVDITVTSESGATFEAAIVDDVARTDGIRAATPVLRRTMGLPRDSYEDVSSITIVGVDPVTAPRVRRFKVEQGRFVQPGDGDVVVLPQDVARRMKVRVGSYVTIPSVTGSTKLRVIGILDTPAVPGGAEGYMALPAAQRFLGERGNITEIEALVDSGVDRNAVERTLSRRLGEDYAVGALDTTSDLFANLEMAGFIMNMFGAFALIMAGFIILNTFRTVVSERRRDIGMLRAVGASRRTIIGMFLVESTVQGALGTALGLFLGWLLGTGLIAVMGPLYRDFGIDVNIGGPVYAPSTWATAITMGMAVTILAALIPAFSASRITPLEAMRPQLGEVYEKATGRRAWIGAAIIALAVGGLLTANTGAIGLSSMLLLVGLALIMPAIVKPVTDVFGELIGIAFRRTGDIARSNLQRNPGRAAATASAVMVSIAIVVSVLSLIVTMLAGFFVYLDKSLGSDFLVMPQSLVLATGNVGADPRLSDRIRDARGVGTVASLRLGRGKLGDTAVQVIGIDPVDYPKVASFEYFQGSSDDDIRGLADEGTVLVNSIFSSQNAVRRGGKLTLETPHGEKTYRVLGVVNDYMNAKLSTVYASQDTLTRDFNSSRDLLLLIDKESGADLEATRRSLERVLDKYPQFTLWDSAGFADSQKELVSQAMAFYYILIGAMAIPTFLALLNTLAISVLARTREIGMLRAVGSTRRQIRRMVLAESLLLAMLGVALGIIGGVWLGYAMWLAMADIGFVAAYSFPWNGILLGVSAGLIFAVLAALIPARQAAKMNVVEALRWE